MAISEVRRCLNLLKHKSVETVVRMWIFIINEQLKKAHNSHTIQEYLKITVTKEDGVYNSRSHNGEELSGFPSAAQLKRFSNASRSVAFKDMLAPTPATMQR